MANPAVILSRAELDELLEGAAERAVRKVLDERGPETEWLDATAVAKMLNIHPRSVQKHTKRSGLPVHKVGLRLFRYRRAEVEAWMVRRG